MIKHSAVVAVVAGMRAFLDQVCAMRATLCLPCVAWRHAAVST